jgi:hypothetical protein
MLGGEAEAEKFWTQSHRVNVVGTSSHRWKNMTVRDTVANVSSFGSD